MPSITINGVKCDFSPGQMILQVANANGLAIPQYCYHDGLTIVASCRICLGEIWAPNPRAGNKLEPYMGGKLMPTCQTPAADGMVVHTDTPKSVANQKAVMEYLLINHPLDCPVCDQAGECLLQDYSYEYGRGVSRFEDDKVKQPKKDVGPHVYLYADRCIMCSRCVRFTREVSGDGALMVQGRGNKSEIDIFPGRALDNELSANVVDLCPVGALLDKDFLFAQRVWFLKETPSIDGLTASGDNIAIHHNEGRVYRVKPRTNMAVNKWWITDEVRYGWKFVHSEDRLRSPMRRQFGTLVESDFTRAYEEAVAGLKAAAGGGKRVALVVSPMLSCEEAWLLGRFARAIDPKAVLAVGPVPVNGKDKMFPPTADEAKGFKVYAEKAPNARGVRRVLEAIAGAKDAVLPFDRLLGELKRGGIGAVVLTGNYPSIWATDELLGALNRAPAGAPGAAGLFTVLIDTLSGPLADRADVILPGATWMEKAGTFENARGMLQAFEQAIPVIEMAKSEGQIALDLSAALTEPTPGTPSARAGIFNAAEVRRAMAAAAGLEAFTTGVSMPIAEGKQEAEMAVVEL
jgi:NADH-quinone oxidoreductase subunit G